MKMYHTLTNALYSYNSNCLLKLGKKRPHISNFFFLLKHFVRREKLLFYCKSDKKIFAKFKICNNCLNKGFFDEVNQQQCIRNVKCFLQFWHLASCWKYLTILTIMLRCEAKKLEVGKFDGVINFKLEGRCLPPSRNGTTNLLLKPCALYRYT